MAALCSLYLCAPCPSALPVSLCPPSLCAPCGRPLISICHWNQKPRTETGSLVLSTPRIASEVTARLASGALQFLACASLHRRLIQWSTGPEIALIRQKDKCDEIKTRDR